MTSVITDRLTGSAITANSRTSGLGSSKAIKAPCLVKTTANITLSGLQTIDGVSVVADDWVCVGSQTAQTANGIYVASTGAWTRRADFDDNADVETGTIVYVTSGSTGAGMYAVTTVADPIEIGSDNITFGSATSGGSGFLTASNNLSDLANAATARTNLGGTTLGKDLFTTASAAAARTSLGLVIGTNVQAWDNTLDELAAISGVSGDIIYSDGNDSWTRLAKGSNTQVLTLTGGLPSWATPGAASGTVSPPGGRLTLTTAVPVLTSTVSAAGTVYYPLYNSQYVPVYDGSSFTMLDIVGELSNVLANSAVGSAGPAAAANNSNYDLFVWSNAGTPTLSRGPLWTSDTARGSGAGTTELNRIKGVMLNAQAITNGPGANRGTYVGTVRTNGTATVDFIFGALATGGTAGVVGVWNMYNRLNVSMFVQDDTNSWNYSTATWRAANASNGMRVSFVAGLAEESIDATYYALATNNTAAVAFRNGIGYDATNALASGCISGLFSAPVASYIGQLIARFTKPTDLGWHFCQAIEHSNASGTTTWYGDNAAPTTTQTGLVFNFRA